MKKQAFMAAMKQFFGFRPAPHNTLKAFKDELDALTPKDQLDLYDGLKAIGVECEPPSKALHLMGAAAMPNAIDGTEHIANEEPVAARA